VGTGTWAGPVSASTGGFRPGTSSTSANLVFTGTGSFSTRTFIIPRGNVTMAGNASFTAGGNPDAIGRSTSPSVPSLTVRHNATVNFSAAGASVNMGGGLATSGTITR